MKKITNTDPLSMSADLAGKNLDHLRELYPEAFTEGKLDFDVLKQLLGGAVEEREEKYGLNWYGKRRARQLALTSSNGTLRPCPADSVDWDTTQNLMIEGDNLEVLKLLQKSYSGRVKLIYIDPPYNTGKDFIYPDKYDDNLSTYLRYTGQVNDEGFKTSSNTEASGRFHTNWLNMMYPRLRVARTLLREDGLIFISISDPELSNLLALCNDVFGEANHLATFVVVNEGNIDNQSRIKTNHEYVVAYAKDERLFVAPPVVDPNIPKTSKIFREEIENTVVQNGPGNPVSSVALPVGFPADFDDGTVEPKPDFWPRLSRPVQVHSGRTCNAISVESGWKCKSLFEDFIRGGFEPVLDAKGQQTVFYLSKTGAVFYRKRRLDEQSHMLTVLRGMGTVQSASARLEKMGISFSYPKPTPLLEYLIRAGTSAGDLVLDFFAGSGSTGEAAMNVSTMHGNRRFILVQLPEPTGHKDYTTIARLAEERLRRAAQQLRVQNPMFAGDLGFRVFELASSNIHAWDPDRQNLQKSLLESVDHLKTDRTETDILYELLLKLGLDLCVPIEKKKISGKDVHSIGGGVLLACLADKITGDQVEPLAEGIVKWHRALAPAGDTTCVFRDSAFADDVAKTNLAAILNQHGLANVRSL